MSKVEAYSKDRTLNQAIEAHKRIMNGATSEDLVSFGYEAEAPIDRIYSHNQFTVISALDFNFDESTKPESESRKYLDELAKQELPNEQIIESLLKYREEKEIAK